MKNTENNKKFYKLWWFWVIIALSTLMIFQTLAIHKQSTSMSDKTTIKSSNKSSKSKKTSGHITTNTEKGTVPKKTSLKESTQSLEFEDEKLNVLSRKKYNLDFSDDSWSSAAIRVNNVEIIKTDSFVYNESTNDKAQGLAIVNISIMPSKDIYAYMSSANLITNDGQQIETEYYSIKNYKENPSGEIANGAKKNGNLIFPIDKLDQIENIKNIRLKFSAADDDELDNHDYDFTINLYD